MNIRPFEKSDYTAVLDIYSKSKLDELVNETRAFDLLPLEDDHKRLDQLMESDIYVCESDEIVGYAALFDKEIRALFVDPASRGKGAGRLLLEFLLAKIEGIATLYVAKTNINGKRLYQEYGFSVVDEFETEYNGIPVLANKMMRAERQSTS